MGGWGWMEGDSIRTKSSKFLVLTQERNAATIYKENPYKHETKKPNHSRWRRPYHRPERNVLSQLFNRNSPLRLPKLINE
jgi:hypothetical protein